MLCVGLFVWWILAHELWDDYEELILSYEPRDARQERVIRAAFCSLIMFVVFNSSVSWEYWMAFYCGLFLFNMIPIRIRI